MSASSTLIRSLRIEDAEQPSDLRIQDGRITAIAPSLDPLEGEEIVEGHGRLALPPIIAELDASVEGAAAVLGAYTLVLAVGLPGEPVPPTIFSGPTHSMKSAPSRAARRCDRFSRSR